MSLPRPVLRNPQYVCAVGGEGVAESIDLFDSSVIEPDEVDVRPAAGQLPSDGQMSIPGRSPVCQEGTARV